MIIKINEISDIKTIYSFKISEDNPLDSSFVKSFILDANPSKIKDVEFSRQILDLSNLLDLVPPGIYYEIAVVNLDVFLEVIRIDGPSKWDLKNISVNFTKSQLDDLVELLKRINK